MTKSLYSKYALLKEACPVVTADSKLNRCLLILNSRSLVMIVYELLPCESLL